MQERTSRFYWCSRILLMCAVGQMILPVAAQTSSSTSLSFTPPAAQTSINTAISSTPFASQSTASPIPQQAQFLGGTPSGKATAEPISLTLREAIERGLRYNLGLVLSGISSRSARAQRLRALSDLLPHVAAKTTESEEVTNLTAFGIPVPLGTSSIIGPFNVFDARGTLTESLNLHFWKNYRAASEEVHAEQFGEQNARETVVLVVADLYLEGLANRARVKSAQAQLATSDAVYKQTLDLKNSGVAAGIDVLRSRVNLQSRQQRLVAVENEYTKQKLTLARAIGLPAGQQFEFGDAMPNPEVPPVTVEKALADALQNRFDYQQSRSLVRAAETARSAAILQRAPSLNFDGDYGTIGRTPASAHPTYTAALSLRIPIFEGGKIQADVQQADALLAQRQAELEDLRGRIDQEVRTAFLDLDASARQVQVARSSVQLAAQQLEQARDRFRAGVSGSLEVVESQQAVAGADEDLISSMYTYNLAKAALARATGLAEKSVKDFLGGR